MKLGERVCEGATACLATGIVWVVLGVIAVAYVLRPRDEVNE